MNQDDFQTEPVPGLPERLPPGEHILWQGAPRVWALATQSLRLYWVAGWFLLIFGWRVVSGAAVMPWAQSVIAASFVLILGAIVCGLLFVIALVQAKASLYTITNRRVVMRIGAALTMTLNLPFREINNAHLAVARDGTGTIAFEMKSRPSQLGYVVLWPHARPGRLRQVEPALRCIAEPQQVAAIFAQAAETEISLPVISRVPQSVAAE
ncbi:MAG: photosynthetic complex putative assembly protein PuhB [Pseudomonadota bacterium]